MFKKLGRGLRYGTLLRSLVRSLKPLLARMGLKMSLYDLHRAEFDKELCIEPKLEAVSKLVRLETSDVKAICAVLSSLVTKAKVRRRLALGDRCGVIKHEGNIAGHIWWNEQKLSADRLSFSLKKDEAYISDVYVVETYRGKRLGPYMLSQLRTQLAKMGRTTVFGVTNFFNKPSLMGWKKRNTRPLRLYLYVNLLNKVHWNFVLRNYANKGELRELGADLPPETLLPKQG